MTNTSPDIKNLMKRINQAKQKQSKNSKISPAKIIITNALQITIEIISPVIISSCIGYVLDKIFNTLPFIMLFMIVLGIATGVFNSYRYAIKIDQQMKED